MNGLSTEAKVGILVLLAAFILAFLSFRAGQFSFNKRDGYTLFVGFNSVAGLEKKAQVKINGVDAGYVEDITLIKGAPQLRLWIKEDFSLYENAVAKIGSLGLMGEKYVEIYPGSEDFPLLKNGDKMVSGHESKDFDMLTERIGILSEDLIAIVHSIKNVIASQEGQERLTQIMENMEKMTLGLNNMIVQNQKEINRLVTNLAQFSEDLNHIVYQNKDKVTNIMTDFNTFSADLSSQGRKMVEDMTTVTESLRRVVDPNTLDLGDMMKRIGHVTETLDLTLEDLHQIAQKMNKGEGTIGKLLTDEKMYEQISGAVGEIHTTLKRTQSFSLNLGFRAEYLTEYEKSKSYFSLRLIPKEGKYYELAFVDDFKDHISTTRRIVRNGKLISVEEEYDEELLISLLMAKRFGPFFLKGGLMESDGGLGIEYYPSKVLKDRFCLGMEAWDFDNERPHLKLFARFAFRKYFFLDIGWDDFASSDTQSFFAGAGFTFEDEDLKYIITKLPLPGLK